MTRWILISALVSLTMVLAGCADTDESVNDPDTVGDPEDDGLDTDADNTTMDDTTTTDTTTTDTGGVYGG